MFYDVTNFYEVSGKISGITLDNASANSKFIEEFENILTRQNLNFNMHDQHFRCLAHIVNLAVQDVFKLMKIEVSSESVDEAESYECDESIIDNQIACIVVKIRQLLKKIRNSEKLTVKLKNFCDVLDIKYRKPIIDSKTRWNSTFDMLELGMDMKDGLNSLCDKNTDLKELKIYEKEWSLVEKMVTFLRDFKAVTEKISGEKYVTLPGAVIAMNCLLDKIEREAFDLDAKEDRDSIDEQLILAFQKGRDKLMKHYSKFNWIYCISLVLDPRIKSNGLNSTAWGQEMKETTLKKFKSVYDIYYDKFAKKNISEEPAQKKRKVTTKCSLNFDALYVSENNSSSCETEMQNYLNSPQCKPETNILEWWKNSESVFPILSRMARDILCIQATKSSLKKKICEVDI